MPILISNSPNDEGNSSLNNLVSVVRNALGWLGQAPDASGRMRVTVEAFGATIGTVSAVTSMNTLVNQQQAGSFYMADQVPALMNASAASLRSRITVT